MSLENKNATFGDPEAQPRPTVIRLAPGLSHEVTNTVHSAEEPVAELRLGIGQHDEAAGSRLQVIDLRGLPFDNNGARDYNGHSLDPAVDFLLVSGELDWENTKGFKGIRPGERVFLGRNHLRDRFPAVSPKTSRTHAELHLDNKTGALVLHDTNSRNGTTLTIYPASKTLGAIDTYPRVHATESKPGESLDITARIISPNEIDAIRRRLYKDPHHKELVRELAASERFAPQIGLEKDGRRILVSNLVTSIRNRKHAALYITDKNGEFTPRLAYKSNSDGGWRISPYIAGGVYSKGDVVLPNSIAQFVGSEYGQYVQATKPVEAVAALLEEMEVRDDFDGGVVGQDELNKYFHVGRLLKNAINIDLQRSTNILVARGRGMEAYVSGRSNEDPAIRQKLETMQAPAGFTPDFERKPERRYQIEHPLLGNCIVQVFPAQLEGRQIHWHVAESPQGDVWVDRIIADDSRMNDFGTYDTIVLAGALSAKPVDYKSAHEYSPEIQKLAIRQDGTYDNMRHVIALMPWAKGYRQARDKS